jgi:hypothetical protein
VRRVADRSDRSLSTAVTDGRPPLDALWGAYAGLARAADLQRAVWGRQELAPDEGGPAQLPLLAFHTRARGPALWLLAGIHGEEPAGPIAIAAQDGAAQPDAGLLALWAQGTPAVLFPLCNPRGYALGWRYPNQRRQEGGLGASVGDCEHLLPEPAVDGDAPTRPRPTNGPACAEAGALAEQIVALMADYPPLLCLDLHEDEDESSGFPAAYVYSQGILGADDPAARALVGILAGHFPVPRAGCTRFGERITDGIIPGTRDGSVDELLSAPALIRAGSRVPGPAARTVLVVETPTRAPLERRVAAHKAILRALPELWTLSHRA